MTIKLGEVVLASKLHLQDSLSPNARRAQLKTPPGHLGVFLYLGDVDADTHHNFVPDGALLAIGYGPQMNTKKQRALVAALHGAQAYVLHPDEEQKDELLAQIEAALAGVSNFIRATS
jgi:hypothetical protein